MFNGIATVSALMSLARAYPGRLGHLCLDRDGVARISIATQPEFVVVRCYPNSLPTLEQMKKAVSPHVGGIGGFGTPNADDDIHSMYEADAMMMLGNKLYERANELVAGSPSVTGIDYLDIPDCITYEAVVLQDEAYSLWGEKLVDERAGALAAFLFIVGCWFQLKTGHLDAVTPSGATICRRQVCQALYSGLNCSFTAKDIEGALKIATALQFVYTSQAVENKDVRVRETLLPRAQREAWEISQVLASDVLSESVLALQAKFQAKRRGA